jgi:hypothetical protein
MLMSIPVISPIELTLRDSGVRRLPPPDYEVHALPPAGETLTLAAIAVTPEPADAATVALDEIERAAQISEYHDFSWWDQRIRIIRARLAATVEGP